MLNLINLLFYFALFISLKKNITALCSSSSYYFEGNREYYYDNNIQQYFLSKHYNIRKWIKITLQQH